MTTHCDACNGEVDEDEQEWKRKRSKNPRIPQYPEKS